MSKKLRDPFNIHNLLLLLILEINFMCVKSNIRVDEGGLDHHNAEFDSIQIQHQSSLNLSSTQELSARKPVIGILSMPSQFLNYSQQNYSYIFSSYVDYVKSSGARVVPIKYTWSNSKLQRLMGRINGLVIPGGGTNLVNKVNFNGKSSETQFFKKGRYLIRQAIQMNQNQTNFPIMGICLGFQMMALVFDNSTSIFRNFKSLNHSQRIHVLSGVQSNSLVFKQMNKTVIRSGENEKLFFFNHKYAITLRKLKKNKKLRRNWKPIALSHDNYGEEFIAIAETKKYPFIGVQFHPEKSGFDPTKNLDINHSEQSINFSKFILEAFIDEAKQNNNKFKSVESFQNYSILGYSPVDLKNFEMKAFMFNNIDDQEFRKPKIMQIIQSEKKKKTKSKKKAKKHKQKSLKLIPQNALNQINQTDIQQFLQKFSQTNIGTKKTIKSDHEETSILNYFLVSVNFSLVVLILKYFPTRQSKLR